MMIGSPDAESPLPLAPPLSLLSFEVLHAAPIRHSKNTSASDLRAIPLPPQSHVSGIRTLRPRACQDRYRLPLGVRIGKNPALEGTGADGGRPRTRARRSGRRCASAWGR